MVGPVNGNGGAHNAVGDHPSLSGFDYNRIQGVQGNGNAATRARVVELPPSRSHGFSDLRLLRGDGREASTVRRCGLRGFAACPRLTAAATHPAPVGASQAHPQRRLAELFGRPVGCETQPRQQRRDRAVGRVAQP